MSTHTDEVDRLRAKSRYAVRAKDEEKLDFGDDFSSFPVEQLKLLASLGDRHRLGYREVTTLGLSKLPAELAADVIERMRDMRVCTHGSSKEFGGIIYVPAKGHFKRDRFMHRSATDTRLPPCWVVGGPAEIYDEAVLNQQDDAHYAPGGDVAILTKRVAPPLTTSATTQSASSARKMFGTINSDEGLYPCPDEQRWRAFLRAVLQRVGHSDQLNTITLSIAKLERGTHSLTAITRHIHSLVGLAPLADMCDRLAEAPGFEAAMVITPTPQVLDFVAFGALRAQMNGTEAKDLASHNYYLRQNENNSKLVTNWERLRTWVKDRQQQMGGRESGPPELVTPKSLSHATRITSLPKIKYSLSNIQLGSEELGSMINGSRKRRMDSENTEEERSKLRDQERMKERTLYENELEQITRDETARAEMKADVKTQHEFKCQAIRIEEDRVVAEELASQERMASTKALELQVASGIKDGAKSEAL